MLVLQIFGLLNENNVKDDLGKTAGIRIQLPVYEPGRWPAPGKKLFLLVVGENG